MKLFRRFCLLFLVFVLLMGTMVPAFAQPETADALPVTSGCSTLDAMRPLGGTDKLLDTTKAAILYELDSDTLVYAWKPDEKLDPSGMNKLMTALLALEQGDPAAVVTVTKSALDSVTIGSVSAGLKVGEEISLRDLLYCMMVGSANDAAAVIAEHIAGSQPDFVVAMNEKAASLGCRNTQFKNANGLSADGQYSTARDLAKITEAALENETFVELFSAVSYTVPATNKCEERKILTTNHMMSKETVRTQFDERVTGGKTGALSTTDRSFISTAEHSGKRYLSVVMSAQGTVTANGLSVKTYGSFEETKVLLDHGFQNYTLRQVLYANQVMEQFSVAGGENDVTVKPATDLTVALPVEAGKITYKCSALDGITAPVQSGQAVGSVEVWMGDICVGQSDLVAMYNVYEPGTYSIPLMPSATEPGAAAWLKWVVIGLLVLLGMGAIAGLLLLAVRILRKPKKKHRRKTPQRR